MTPESYPEIDNYRAHRFAITKLEDGEFALFDPGDTLIAIGSISELEPLILTGPEHYDTCVNTFVSRKRTSEPSQLLLALGLSKQSTPTAPIRRRF